MEVKVKTYRGEKAFQRDAAKMARSGWHVVSSTSRNPNSGCLRVLILGAFIFKPKPVITATYERQRG